MNAAELSAVIAAITALVGSITGLVTLLMHIKTAHTAPVPPGVTLGTATTPASSTVKVVTPDTPKS